MHYMVCGCSRADGVHVRGRRERWQLWNASVFRVRSEVDDVEGSVMQRDVVGWSEVVGVVRMVWSGGFARQPVIFDRRG
jgi:hypothetical protein